jgi:DNA repair exonuclease SbcCD ATPase subunit
MHVVGVPVHEGYKKGLNKQVSKTKVFTKDSLSMLQDKMRERVEDRMKDMDIFKDMELKAKERGRNKDYRKEELTGLYDLQEQEKEKQEHVFELDCQLREKNKNVRELDKKLDKIKAELESLENAKSNADDQIKAYDLISKKAEKHKIPPIEIGSQNVSDGLFKSHTEYFVKIPCKDEKAAQRRLNEVKAIYTKNFTKEDLQEQIEDIAHDAADTRQLLEDTHKRIRQESDMLDLAKEQAKAEIAQAKAAAKDAFIADTQIYKNLNLEKMGYSQNSLGRLVSNEIAQTLVRDAVYEAYDWLKQNGCLKQDKLLNKSKAAMASIKNLGTDISSFEDRVKKNMINQLAQDERMINSVLEKGKSISRESHSYDFER